MKKVLHSICTPLIIFGPMFMVLWDGRPAIKAAGTVMLTLGLLIMSDQIAALKRLVSKHGMQDAD